MRLALFILAYNSDEAYGASGLGNFRRRLCLPKVVKDWSLRSLQLKFIKIGGRLLPRKEARRLMFQLPEVAVLQGVFQQVLELSVASTRHQGSEHPWGHQS